MSADGKTILGEFLNQYGERFVLTDDGGEVFIDGDEFDWKPRKLAQTDFLFAPEELREINRILADLNRVAEE